MEGDGGNASERERSSGLGRPDPTLGVSSSLEHTPYPSKPPERVAILRPLRVRDFRMLWSGMAVSLLGDGIYFVAIAWQVYELSDAPTALALVGAAFSLPEVAFLLLGGVVTDRFDRRKVLIASDVVRGLAIAVMAVLSLSSAIELWHIVVLVALYGTGEAFFFGPAFGAIVPEVVPNDLLVEANSLGQFARPIAWRFAGPALGGWIIAAFGAGWAFMLDAATFALSALFVAAMSPRPVARSDARVRSALREVAEGFRYVRSRRWLWATIVAAAVGQFAFYGPYQVLMPYVVKYELGGGAGDLGLVYAAGGVGALLASVALGQRGLPRRQVLSIYIGWGVGTLGLVGFALSAAPWQAMLASGAMIALFTVGIIVWNTLMHQLVPGELLGRVSSFDWFVSSGLIPLSYALAGPAAAALGARATLIGAGVCGCAVMLAFLAIPGVRDIGAESDAGRAAQAA